MSKYVYKWERGKPCFLIARLILFVSCPALATAEEFMSDLTYKFSGVREDLLNWINACP